MSRYQFIREPSKPFPVGRMCALLAVSRSGYDPWRARPERARFRSNQALLAEIQQTDARRRGIDGAPRACHQWKALEGPADGIGRPDGCAKRACRGADGDKRPARRIPDTASRWRGTS